MAVRRFFEAIRDAMTEEMAQDPRVMILGEDVGVNGGVFQVTAGMQKQFGAERVLDTPLS